MNIPEPSPLPEQTTPKQHDIVLSEENIGQQKFFLCSCPTLFPTFVVRHPSKDDAVRVMQNIVNFMISGDELAQVPVLNMQKMQVNKLILYFSEAPSVAPGHRSFGLTEEQGLRHLGNHIEKIINNQAKSPHKIIWGNDDGKFYSVCPTVLPLHIRSGDNIGMAFNSMAREVTDELLNQELHIQAEAPIIITGAYHSGTSALARLLLKNGVSLGNNLNWALDENEVNQGVQGVGPFRGIRDLICHYYPGRVDCSLPESELLLLQDYFFRLVKEKVYFPYWGWKGPTSLFLMPLLAKVFPRAKFLQIIRDGRDVALSPHGVFPSDEYGKLIYFDNKEISEWEGITLHENLGKEFSSNKFDPPPTAEACRFWAYIWQKMSILGDENGKRIGPSRYMRVCFEDLCLSPEKTVAQIADFLNIPLDHSVMEWRKDRVKKFKNPPEWASIPGFIEALEENCREGLQYFGYEL